jgi:hypothetical protein
MVGKPLCGETDSTGAIPICFALKITCMMVRVATAGWRTMAKYAMAKNDPSWTVDKQIDEYQRKKQGKQVTVYNKTGRDIVVAVYKIKRDVLCVRKLCRVSQTVRRSSRLIIRARDPRGYTLYYKGLSFLERITPGVSECIYWTIIPAVKPGEKETSLLRLYFDVRRLAKQKKMDYREWIALANKHWALVSRYYLPKQPGRSDPFLITFIRPLLQQNVNQVLLADNLEAVPLQATTYVALHQHEFRGMLIAYPNGPTTLPISKNQNLFIIPPVPPPPNKPHITWFDTRI